MYRYVSLQELFSVENGTHSLEGWGKQILEDSATTFAHCGQKYIFWFTGEPRTHLYYYTSRFARLEVCSSHALGHGIAIYTRHDIWGDCYGRETWVKEEHPEAYTRSIPSEYKVTYPARWVIDLEIEEELERLNEPGIGFACLNKDGSLWADCFTDAELAYIKWLLK